MNKVFCSKCRWFDCGYNIDDCEHPKNYGDSPIKENSIHMNRPRDINKRNDCAWYERKVGIFERIENWFRYES